LIQFIWYVWDGVLDKEISYDNFDFPNLLNKNTSMIPIETNSNFTKSIFFSNRKYS